MQNQGRKKMKIHSTGTLIDGLVHLDKPIEIPNKSRVTVNLELTNHDLEKAKEAFEAFKTLIKNHPVHSGGVQYTRDELHERN